MSPTLSVCVPTLRGYDRVARLLRSIEAHTGHVSWEAVVVDCGTEMRGYTAPQNQAMAGARGNYLLAVNDDVEVTAGWLEPLLGAVRDGAWCATPDMNQDGLALLFAPHLMLWSAHAWREIGGLDEQFRHWASDIDLARRLMEAGHPPARVRLPETPPHHNGTGVQSDILNEMCLQDLDRYQRKWGVAAEFDKHRLGAVLRGEQSL